MIFKSETTTTLPYPLFRIKCSCLQQNWSSTGIRRHSISCQQVSGSCIPPERRWLLSQIVTINIKLQLFSLLPWLVTFLHQKSSTKERQTQTFLCPLAGIFGSDNHWSNEETMKRYVEKIVVSYLDAERVALKLSKSHPALAIFDCFRG